MSQKLNIAIYSDEATAERYQEKALRKNDMPYHKINFIEIKDGALEEVDVLCLPGMFPFRRHGKGGLWAVLRSLNRIGGELKVPILDYVEGGGGLLAVCGSASVLGKKVRFPYIPTGLGIPTMGIFDYSSKFGTKLGVVRLKPKRYGDERDVIIKSILGRYGDDKSFKTLYFRGPLLMEAGNELVVAEFLDKSKKMNGKGAIAYKEHGKGKILACSVHPEFTTSDLLKYMIEHVAR
ncbi:MAG: hypothetical protein QCI38_08955 [Candidatus Thermoplasmatota archaeon]|nr:hypothetical protein [Candidatus Thermoplasmatota archaeon]